MRWYHPILNVSGSPFSISDSISPHIVCTVYHRRSQSYRANPICSSHWSSKLQLHFSFCSTVVLTPHLIQGQNSRPPSRMLSRSQSHASVTRRRSSTTGGLSSSASTGFSREDADLQKALELSKKEAEEEKKVKQVLPLSPL